MFHTSPPHWSGINKWNPVWLGARTYLPYLVDMMLLITWRCKEPGHQHLDISLVCLDWSRLSMTRLTHWGRDKMAAIFQTSCSNGFSWVRMYEFQLKFHWSLFLGAQLTIFYHWFIQWLGADHATSSYLNQWWWVYWRIYASPGLNELRHCIHCSWIVEYYTNFHSVTGPQR